MTINSTVYCIVDAAGKILGDGECAAIYPSEPDEQEIAMVKRMSECPDARVVRCYIAEAMPTSLSR